MVLLVGALVHLPYEKFKPVFENISTCLNENGKVLVTLKEGNGLFKDAHGRVFYLWQDKDLRDIFADLGYGILDFNRQKYFYSRGRTILAGSGESCLAPKICLSKTII